MSHLMTCAMLQLHVDRPGYPKPCLYQLCQTLGGVYLTVAIEDSTKKNKYIISSTLWGRDEGRVRKRRYEDVSQERRK